MELDNDDVSGFTHEQKYENFLKIMTTVRYLDDGGRITEDWMEEHKKLILQYREWIPDYSVVNDEVQEVMFRTCCQETEILISHLVNSVRTTGTFPVKTYHIFMRRMKQILETVLAEDELSDLLSMLSV